MPPITFGILTISDSCSKFKQKDKSGPVLQEFVINKESIIGKLLHGQIQCTAVIPDDKSIIIETLTNWSDKIGVNVILTTGGTGFSNRDVTPEATRQVIEKDAPGISYAMLSESMKITPMAMLSRAICGIRGKTLIINLPGSPKAVKECFGAIANVIPHAVDLILDNKNNVTEVHQNLNDGHSHHEQTHNVHTHHNCPHKNSKSLLNLDNVAGRLRESPFPMISVEESQKILKETAESDIPSVKVNIWDSFGRVLSETVHSPLDLPPFRASTKDGYAVIAKDGKGKRQVLGGIEAGFEPGSVKIVPGTCVRINTGAAVPDEATAVVQVEDTKLLQKGNDGKEELEIEILTDPKEEQDIRPIGSDIRAGDAVLRAGTKLGAVEMGILAACGCAQIAVTREPRIGVLSTGNELQEAGEPAKPGHVYDSNKITLMTMLRERGYGAVDLGIASDREEVMIAAIEKALNQVDVIITTGSVSMGDRDMLKPVLTEVFKATIHFGRINMKPGKPTTFATCIWKEQKKYFLCLPGNPVSAMVTASLYVFPLLNLLTGNNAKPIVVNAKLTSTYILDPRPEYARVILIWPSGTDEKIYPNAYSTGNQISSKLLSCKNANGLLILPGRSTQITELPAGSVVPALLLGFDQHDG